MSMLSFSLTAAGTKGSTQRIASLARQAVTAIETEWRARRAARSAAALSDEVLHDIGLTRSEIDRAVRYGRARS